MSELRHRSAKCLIKQDLLVRIGEMVLTADHVCDSHLDIIQHDRQVVEWMAVRTQKHEIFNLGIGALLLAIDDVFESRRALTRYLQTDGKWFAGRSASIGFLFCQIAE